MHQVPLQVMSQRTAEAQRGRGSQSGVQQNYVADSVAADVDSIYKLIQVSSSVNVAAMPPVKYTAAHFLVQYCHRHVRLSVLHADCSLMAQEPYRSCKRKKQQSRDWTTFEYL